MDGPGLWRLTLDQDLLDTLSRRFPTWFDSGDSPPPPKTANSDSDFVESAETYFSVNLTEITGMAEGKAYKFQE